MHGITLKWQYFFPGLIFILLLSGCDSNDEQVTFPFSQWTIGSYGPEVTWLFNDNIECNNSFIASPLEDEWDEWYNNILTYRKTVRREIGKNPPGICISFPSTGSPRLHFNKIGYSLKISPGETLNIHCMYKDTAVQVKVFVEYILKKKGEENGYIDRGIIRNTDSLELNKGQDWFSCDLKFRVPPFNSDSFSVSPFLRFEGEPGKEGKIYAKDIRLSLPFSPERKELLTQVENVIRRQEKDNTMNIPVALSWTNRNFVMGFVFIWDQDFWDPVKGKYAVSEYCEKMQREFGGFQSVILWQAYPNLGIDKRNQFDFYRSMPGGLEGLKQVVDDFHTNKVKVFLTYNPWDQNTGRSGESDAKELAQLTDECGFDGIYLDTWSSAAGVVSIFSDEASIREEVEKTGNTVAFETELVPEFKDLIGYNAVTSSWGQDIHPYHYTDLSLFKWIFPGHMQHFIVRENTNRRRELAHAWINGQGIQVWENLFGDMNLWNASDRHSLRKMNMIWKVYGDLYLTDNMKPFIPTGNTGILVSSWEMNGMKLWNAVDESEGRVINVRVQVDADHRYFDLWHGSELKVFTEDGKNSVFLPVSGFGCLLQLAEGSEMPAKLLTMQQNEDYAEVPDSAHDPHMMELSLKYPSDPPAVVQSDVNTSYSMLKVSGGRYSYRFSHLNREGRCYPDTDAKNNHDLVFSKEGRNLEIIHNHIQQLAPYAIGTSVVTNAEFEIFLKATNYTPAFPENFLKHWGGRTCPDSLKNEAVVYVSLEDAREYASWAGKRLPTEWEWQTAAERYGVAFKINEVWEWNESERNDGFNRFVNLRGGCSRWSMSGSWWYFPGAFYGKVTGGPQPYNSHCKYFLMYPGMDRASTIGFRCVSVYE